MQHLQILEECGLVSTHKVGRVRTCQLNPNGLDAIDKWTTARKLKWEKRLDRLGKFLDEE